MREEFVEQSKKDDNKNINSRIAWAWVLFVVLAAAVIVGAVVYGLPVGNIRDLLLTLLIVILFAVNVVLIWLYVTTTEKIKTAKTEIIKAAETADGKTEELTDRIAEIMKRVLSPVVDLKSFGAGIKNIFRKD